MHASRAASKKGEALKKSPISNNSKEHPLLRDVPQHEQGGAGAGSTPTPSLQPRGGAQSFNPQLANAQGHQVGSSQCLK